MYCKYIRDEISTYFDGFSASIPSCRDDILATHDNQWPLITANRMVRLSCRYDWEMILVYQGDLIDIDYILLKRYQLSINLRHIDNLRQH